MIQVGTNLKICDNTGAKFIRCFTILGGTRHRYAKIGDIIVASVKKAEPRRAVRKGEVVRAIIVRQKFPFRLPSGVYLRFDDNAAIILEGETKIPKGNRITGPVPQILKEKGFEKIIAMASVVV
ncbi:MAG: 50S ribosomal protein L14 [Parcubacteria group bacterium CG_4_9_14_0_2_um_filter_35_11]|nr:MAG: 50S ribosomal protein L14 [Parcubacteria group bacterium CG07_land_8_20_14_0_80_35_11]PJC48028.1 MAG: 50S ribosomal protein L14 [Parcubacteria group bacterium CG_4_9_14_0_2_um_filter_35_11]